MLFKELNLKVDSVPLMKKKKLMCTNKQVLQDLAEQTKHPLPEVILQWRKIRSITTKVDVQFFLFSDGDLLTVGKSHLLIL